MIQHFDGHDWVLDRIEGEVLNVGPMAKGGFYADKQHIPTTSTWVATMDKFDVDDVDADEYTIPESTTGTAKNMAALLDYYSMGDIVGLIEQDDGTLLPVDTDSEHSVNARINV